MAQISLWLSNYLPVEIAVEKDEHGTGSVMYATIHNFLNNENVIDLRKIQHNDRCLLIFSNLVFSTITKTKKDMLEISKKYNFENILEMTWSCWYPKNGKPCGKCIMCLERII